MTLYYGGKTFARLKRGGFKWNYYDVDTGEHYWISGPRRDGADRLYAGKGTTVVVDEDVREEYWTQIRKLPQHAGRKFA